MDESSTMKEWRAPLLGQFPTAETGYDTLNLAVECITMAVRVCLCGSCMFLSTNVCSPPTKMERNEVALPSPKLATVLFEYSRIQPTSVTNTCHLYLVSDPHTQSLTLTQVCAQTHFGVCAHSGSIQESLFTQPVLCEETESRFELHESVDFEVENGFCPALEMSHAHVIHLLDGHCWNNLPQIPHSSLTSVPAEEVCEKGLCHCLNLGSSDVHLLSCLCNLGLGHLRHVFRLHYLSKDIIRFITFIINSYVIQLLILHVLACCKCLVANSPFWIIIKLTMLRK